MRSNQRRLLTNSPANSSCPGSQSGKLEPLETGCLIPQTQSLDQLLHERILGQDQAINALICSFSRLLSQVRDSSHPVLTALLLGPTGVGKTETAKTLARAIFGSSSSLTTVRAQEYSQGHEIAKLLGSPPGYVGSDIPPLLSQSSLDAHHQAALQEKTGFVGQGLFQLNQIFAAERGQFLSIVLIDEVEKASPLLWNALLGILEEGRLTLGNNQTTDFTRSIILATSNVGSREMSESLDRRHIGFQPDGSSKSSNGLTREAESAARREFPPEFLNRFDEILIYEPLSSQDLERIFDRMMDDVHGRLLEAGCPVLIQLCQEVRQSIVEEAVSANMGARPLRRLVESKIVDPLSRLVVKGDLRAGDVIHAEWKAGDVAFFRTGSPEKDLFGSDPLRAAVRRGA